MEKDNITDFSFDLPKNKSNVIKVIGVGGGGSKDRQAGRGGNLLEPVLQLQLTNPL